MKELSGSFDEYHSLITSRYGFLDPYLYTNFLTYLWDYGATFLHDNTSFKSKAEYAKTTALGEIFNDWFHDRRPPDRCHFPFPLGSTRLHSHDLSLCSENPHKAVSYNTFSFLAPIRSPSLKNTPPLFFFSRLSSNQLSKIYFDTLFEVRIFATTAYTARDPKWWYMGQGTPQPVTWEQRSTEEGIANNRVKMKKNSRDY